MYFSNLNFITIFICFILFLLVLILYIKVILKNKKIIVIGFTFLFLSFSLSILSLLGPRGAIKKDYIMGTNVSFILDVSQSMEVILRGTNKTKLELSKKLISDFIKKNINNNYSLTIFAGDALNIVPFISDIGIFDSFLFGVNKNNLNKTGTDILNALKIGSLNYKNKEDGVIVLITDGGEDKLNNLENLKILFKKKNIKLIVIGIGNIKGNYIQVGFDQTGKVLYKYYNGEKVVIHLSEEILKNISRKLKGVYISIKNNNDLLNIIRTLSTNINEKSLEKSFDIREDLTIYFIFISFIFFMLYYTTLFISKFGLFLGKKD